MYFYIITHIFKDPKGQGNYNINLSEKALFNIWHIKSIAVTVDLFGSLMS